MLGKYLRYLFGFLAQGFIIHTYLSHHGLTLSIIISQGQTMGPTKPNLLPIIRLQRSRKLRRPPSQPSPNNIRGSKWIHQIMGSRFLQMHQ
jgi:hypothetical protein